MTNFNDVEPEYTSKYIMLMDLRLMVHNMERAGVNLNEIYEAFVYAQSVLRRELRRERNRRERGYVPRRFAVDASNV